MFRIKENRIREHDGIIIVQLTFKLCYSLVWHSVKSTVGLSHPDNPNNFAHSHIYGPPYLGTDGFYAIL